MKPLLEIRNLQKSFEACELADRTPVHAVRGVTLTVRRGATLGLVGESGCGKSTLARCAIRLLEPSAGSVLFDGLDLSCLSPADLRRRRREFQLISQDAAASLNPRMTVAETLTEPFQAHRIGTARERAGWVHSLMEKVALDPVLADTHPESLSGGQQQRVAIARSLALTPRLIIADEPVSALDVSVQAQILNLLFDLREQMGLTLMLITHSLPVIHYLCARVAVMYLGRIVEECPTELFFRRPGHPYSRMLLDCMPRQTGGVPQEAGIGEIPSPSNPPLGCAFHPRCPHVMARCRVECPGLLDRDEDCRIACFLFD